MGRREGGKEEPSGRPMRARVSLGSGSVEDTSLRGTLEATPDLQHGDVLRIPITTSMGSVIGLILKQPNSDDSSVGPVQV